jgi:hypothetical protein
MTQRYRTAAGSAATDATLDGSEIRTRSEQLHLRNYDEDRVYRLTVSVSRPDQPLDYEGTYELAPGEVVSELEVVPPGRYDVTVSGSFRPVVDGPNDGTVGRDSDRLECNVGDRLARTVLVECGNGLVALSEGVSR